jgi:hypothetical protein
MTSGDRIPAGFFFRMLSGNAPRRPKDVDQTAERPPILFVSAYGPPGSYDPLARPQKPPEDAQVIPHAGSLDVVKLSEPADSFFAVLGLTLKEKARPK